MTHAQRRDANAYRLYAEARRPHILGHQFRHPGMGNGTGCALMIDEGILCGESADHRMHQVYDQEVAP